MPKKVLANWWASVPPGVIGCVRFIANVSYLVIVFAALSIFTDRGGEVILGDGNTWQALIGESLLLWVVHALVLRGVQTAASINLAATLAKLFTAGAIRGTGGNGFQNGYLHPRLPWHRAR
ncbi:Putative arginine/ornithine antiporter [Serratia odorifera]|uniref:Arginine/ornithine antiporter n=1 Tax=Serratia odorifera TaxID=618 RepID=A0A3S4FU10_SEROD|nr:Putative arginine/ornithine antiporter [Serratia odorifera]